MQAVPTAIALPVPVVPVLTGAAGLAAAALEATTGLATTAGDDEATGVEVVVAGTGWTVAVTTGARSDVGVLAAVVVGSGATSVAAVWMKAPPGMEASALALVVAAGAAVSEVVVSTEAAALEPEDPDDPEDPETKDSEVVREIMVPDWQELGPELQPMSLFATSLA